MKIAFVLFKYFPFGGLQRDFYRIASIASQRGHQVVVYTLSWQGEQPHDFEVQLVPVKAFSNHKKYQRFNEWVKVHLQQHPVDIVFGFNKIPGLDFYYAADPCYQEKAQTLRNGFYRLSSRYKHFYAYEKAVFSPCSDTRILLISEVQKPFFIKHYQTQAERFYLLPPGIAYDRKAPENAHEIRQEFRQTFKLGDDELLMLMIGSGFRTKGLDRALLAMKSLPESLLAKTHFIIIGQDNPVFFTRQAKKLGLAERVTIMAGRDDIPRFLLGGDVLIHPAYNENTGTVLLEAMVAGLPVLVTDICGYAHYIEEAASGIVISSPFEQEQLNKALLKILTDKKARDIWHANGLNFAHTADIYSMPERVVDIIEQTQNDKIST